jgi:hypothetical protein
MYKKIRKGIIKAERANLTILPLSRRAFVAQLCQPRRDTKRSMSPPSLEGLAWRRTWMTADMCFTSSAITI